VPSVSKEPTLFETIDKAARLGLLNIGGSSSQKVDADIPKDFNDQLSGDEMRQIRLKLDTAGVRLLTYRLHGTSSDKAIEFARKMGVEAIITDSGSVVMEPRLEIVTLDDSARNVREAGRKPTVFTVESASDEARLTQSIELFNKATRQLANGGTS
jgi:sugar phosphate isomerase/epimerase